MAADQRRQAQQRDNAIWHVDHDRRLRLFGGGHGFLLFPVLGHLLLAQISVLSSQRCNATYSSQATPSTRMLTVTELRIIKLRSALVSSLPVCVGNHGERIISTPNSMPQQSSHV